jgi:hypothetical protein
MQRSPHSLILVPDWCNGVRVGGQGVSVGEGTITVTVPEEATVAPSGALTVEGR